MPSMHKAHISVWVGLQEMKIFGQLSLFDSQPRTTCVFQELLAHTHPLTKETPQNDIILKKKGWPCGKSASAAIVVGVVCATGVAATADELGGLFGLYFCCDWGILLGYKMVLLHLGLVLVLCTAKKTHPQRDEGFQKASGKLIYQGRRTMKTKGSSSCLQKNGEKHIQDTGSH